MSSNGPLYAVRVSDLGPDDFVHIECPCGHLSDLTPSTLATAGAPPHQKIRDLKRRLKCQACKWKGRAGLTVRWRDEQ